jgi:hypothetical protein
VNALASTGEGEVAASIARVVTKAHGIKSARTEAFMFITDREILVLLAKSPEDESKPAADL